MSNEYQDVRTKVAPLSKKIPGTAAKKVESNSEPDSSSDEDDVNAEYRLPYNAIRF